MALDWNLVMSRTCAVTIRTKRYTGQVTVKPGFIGIEETDAVKAVMRLGPVKVISPRAFERINSIINEATGERGLLKRYGLALPGLVGVRLVRLDRFDDFAGEFELLHLNLESAVAEFAAKYDQYVEEWRPVMRSAFLTACQGRKAAPTAEDEDLADRMCAVIERLRPTAAEAAAQFSMTRSAGFSIGRAYGQETEQALAEEANDVLEVVRSTIVDLRASVTDRLNSIIDLVKRGGKVTKKTTNAARADFNQVLELNIFGDREIIRAVNEAVKWLDRLEQDVEGTIKSGLVGGLETIQASVNEDIEAAVREAEGALTAVGQRRFVGRPVAPTPAQPELPSVAA